MDNKSGVSDSRVQLTSPILGTKRTSICCLFVLRSSMLPECKTDYKVLLGECIQSAHFKLRGVAPRVKTMIANMFYWTPYLERLVV